MGSMTWESQAPSFCDGPLRRCEPSMMKSERADVACSHSNYVSHDGPRSFSFPDLDYEEAHIIKLLTHPLQQVTAGARQLDMANPLVRIRTCCAVPRWAPSGLKASMCSWIHPSVLTLVVRA